MSADTSLEMRGEMQGEFKGFDAVNKKKLESFLQEHKESSERKIAVFDADGTLWRGDVGESFFKHQIQSKTLKSVPSGDLWKLYWDTVNAGRALEAYSWLPVWNAGNRESDLQQWCDEFFEKSFRKNRFEPMFALVNELQHAHFEVWIVSASIRWAVAAGVKTLGIPMDNIIAASVHVQDGVLTSNLIEPFPYREGKVAQIKRHIKDTPLFGAGNTYWDKDMLSICKGLILGVHSEKSGEPNYDSEQKLKAWVTAAGGLTQKF